MDWLQGTVTFQYLRRVVSELGVKISDDELWEMIAEADKDGKTLG